MTRLSRLLLAVASVLLLGVFVLPLWRIELVAPQYPEGLGMLIRVNTVSGIKPNDLANINGLNHYIGMKPIEPAAIPELRMMPWIVAGLAAFGLLGAALGARRLLYGWLGGFVTLAVVGLIDFWRWEYDYGHNIDFEHAIIKVPGMTYQPPLIGTKQLLNFTASSWPALGAVCLSKDQVRYRVFDGWTPDHPVFAGTSDLEVGEARFDEDQVVWSIYFWAIAQAVAVAPVVAETAMTRQVNRNDMSAFLADIDVPVVEVVLQPPREALLERYAARQRSPDAHRIYRTFPPGTENQLLGERYEPLLEPGRVIEIKAKSPSSIDVNSLAECVRSILTSA